MPFQIAVTDPSPPVGLYSSSTLISPDSLTASSMINKAAKEMISAMFTRILTPLSLAIVPNTSSVVDGMERAANSSIFSSLNSLNTALVLLFCLDYPCQRQTTFYGKNNEPDKRRRAAKPLPLKLGAKAKQNVRIRPLTLSVSRQARQCNLALCRIVLI